MWRIWGNSARNSEVMKFNSRALIACILLFISSCAPGAPASPGAPLPSGSTPPAEQPLEDSQSLQNRYANAPVPSLCEHKPGRLRNGTLPDIPPGNGRVEIPQILDDDSQEPKLAIARSNSATGDLVAVVVMCDRGGVAWPANILIYDDKLRLHGAVDIGDMIPGGRQAISAIASIEGGFEFQVEGTPQPDEAICCGTLDTLVRVTASDFGVRATVIDEFSEVEFAKMALQAVQNRSFDSNTELFTGPGLDSARKLRLTPLGITYRPDATPLCSSREPLFWENFTSVLVDERSSSPTGRFCYYDSDNGDTRLSVKMIRAGFGIWRADEVLMLPARECAMTDSDGDGWGDC